jgi:NAD(P)-dependent dehydrogenase (short-subunit alcohol dehydrogenase family)
MSAFDLRGKRCLITGAASGIGRATAIAAAREGAKLVLTDLRQTELEEAAEEIRAAGGEVLLAQAADVSEYEAVRALGERVTAEHGAMDVVMNVAGISTWGAVEALEHHHWRRTVDVDLMGPIHVIESFLPPMIRAGRGGHLVNVASAAGLFGLPRHAPYSAAKFGLRGVSEVLRFDLRRHRIGVSLVCPGGVDTGLVSSVDIVGADRDDPRIAREIDRFRRHAVSPAQAAEAILDGVRKRRYLIYTSRDIHALHLLQRYCEPAYAFLMRLANRRFDQILGPR